MAMTEKEWFTIKYYGTLNSPKDDFCQFDTIEQLEDCLNETVGNLRWGIDQDVRRRSKMRFSRTFSKVLKAFDVLLPYKMVFETMQDDDQTNRQAVDKLFAAADFEPQ